MIRKIKNSRIWRIGMVSILLIVLSIMASYYHARSVANNFSFRYLRPFNVYGCIGSSLMYDPDVKPRLHWEFSFDDNFFGVVPFQVYVSFTGKIVETVPCLEVLEEKGVIPKGKYGQ